MDMQGKIRYHDNYIQRTNSITFLYLSFKRAKPEESDLKADPSPCSG